MNRQFPEISVDGTQVDAKQYPEKGTGLAVFGAFFIAIIATLFGILVSYGILLVVLIFYPLCAWYLRK